MPKFERQVMDEVEKMDITDPPKFAEPDSSKYLVQTIRDPNTGKLCFSVLDFVDPETLKKVSETK